MTTEEKLLHFQEDALTTARAQSAKELDSFSENLNSIYDNHVKTARAQAYSQLTLAKETFKREHNRELSKKQLETRRNLTLTKDAVAEKIFSRVDEMIDAYKNTHDYPEDLLASINEAKKTAGKQELIIYIDESDEGLKEELMHRSGLPIHIAEDNIIGGIVALIPKKNILIDMSFDAKLKEARENLQLGGEVNG